MKKGIADGGVSRNCSLCGKAWHGYLLYNLAFKSKQK
jgi:hypothetical protein